MQNLHRLTSCSLLGSWFQFALFACFRRTISASMTNSELLSLTFIAEGLTSTNSKYISRDPYPLLLCHVIAHAQLMETQETRHVTATHCWCVTSLILRQLPDTQKTQLALLMQACIVFTELLPGNTLIKYITIFSLCSDERDQKWFDCTP
jgi:hypothetical protein